MAVPSAAPLSPEQTEELQFALHKWVERHPTPDDPVLSFVGGNVLSPRQLVSEIAQSTPDSRAFLRMVRFGLEVMPFDRIVAQFAGDATGEAQTR